MPYTSQEDREKFKEDNLEMIGLRCAHEGDLNYVLTCICKGYLSKFGMIKYAMLNTIMGVLECCKLEFYRRICSPYEDIKIKENGDV